MTNAQDAEQEPSPTPYLRLPAPLVALGIVLFLALLLAAGLYANANLRPQGVVLPTPVSTPVPLAVELTTPPLAAATSVAMLQLTETPFSPIPTVQPTLGKTGTLVADQAPTRPVSVIDATSTSTIGVVPTATPLPTIDPTLAAEIGEAYESYWRVSSQALLDLDPTHLSDVMEGPYLQSFEIRLDNLRASGKAIKTQVTLNYKVVEATDTTAVVIDRVEDDSYYVSPGSEDPLSDPANDLLRLELKLINDSGTWKVVESVSAD
jgi:hypothetical protein